jgi:transcriptional regulator NrdR family protein
LTKSKNNIVVKRYSGRKEKFDTDRLTQTVSRSGVSFPVAKDVAKSVTKKIKKSVQNKSTG